jgi:hypothetical protein
VSSGTATSGAAADLAVEALVVVEELLDEADEEEAELFACWSWKRKRLKS